MMRTCGSCGTTNPADALFCGGCGSSFADRSPTDTTGDPFVGHALGGYEVVRRVAATGRCTVYEARRAGTGRPVALKVLPLLLAHDPTIGRRFDALVRSQMGLDHPSLVRVEDVVVDGPVCAIAMEWIVGTSLATMLRDRDEPLSLGEILGIAVPAFGAVGHAHARGVVHGDLKPSNVLMADEGGRLVPKVTDFGVASALVEVVRRCDGGAFAGTFSHSAPEAWRGATEADPRADVYSAGVVLFEMATGHLPFGGRDPFEVLCGHVEEPPPSPRSLRPSIVPELERAILTALEKNPAKRWTDVGAFARALLEIPSERSGRIESGPETALDQVGHLQERLIAAATPEERHHLLVEIGDVWHGKLDIPQKALESYAEALEAKPEDPLTLQKLVEVCRATKQWHRAIRALEKVAGREADGERRARHYSTIAKICRLEMGDLERAVTYYEMALDGSADPLGTFEAIEQMRTQSRDWTGLERDYRKMLRRVSGKAGPETEVSLWHQLGEVYRTRLGKPDAAADAFEAAARLEPGNVGRHRILAELYDAMPGRQTDAMKEHRLLLAADPLRVDSYRALRDAYARAERHDATWCLCAVLVFLDKANDEETRLWEQFRPTGPIRPTSRLDDEHWMRDLFHPDEDVFVGKVFEALTHAVRMLRARSPKACGLRRRERRDPLTDTVAFSKMFGWAARVLAIAMPELYLRPEQPGGLVYAISDPPASVVGADLLSGHSPQALAFVLGRHLAYYRGEHYVRWMAPTAPGLRTLLLAGLRIGAPGVDTQDSVEAVEETAKALASRMTPEAKELLRRVCDRLLRADRPLDVDKWIRAVDLTACRTGLLLCGDLQVAARLLGAEPAVEGETPPKEKIKELLLFAASEEYFRLRETLGIAVTSGA